MPPAKAPEGEDKKLLTQPYYHGLLPREDMREMLQLKGDFVVRMSEPRKGRPRAYIVSVLVDGDATKGGCLRHYVINYKDKKYFIDQTCFDSVDEMIAFHIGKKTSISQASRATKAGCR